MHTASSGSFGLFILTLSSSVHHSKLSVREFIFIFKISQLFYPKKPIFPPSKYPSNFGATYMRRNYFSEFQRVRCGANRSIRNPYFFPFSNDDSIYLPLSHFHFYALYWNLSREKILIPVREKILTDEIFTVSKNRENSI